MKFQDSSFHSSGSKAKEGTKSMTYGQMNRHTDGRVKSNMLFYVAVKTTLT